MGLESFGEVGKLRGYDNIFTGAVETASKCGDLEKLSITENSP